MTNPELTQRFGAYFDREVARNAAASLSNGVEMELQVLDEAGKAASVVTFTKVAGKNQVREGKASDPQIVFTMTPAAAEAILGDTSEDIGAIGVNIAKLILSPDANRRVGIQMKAGFLSLFSKGYFGVVTAGGGAFASFLASKGLNGMGAIKAALGKKK